ncbi:hypothetical protein E2C01_093607 [Portunus trituberculatus]|uniref:Uncharacterized protein n=1 Tax=Portunus trituberculatus TaxID=210409 RepID=A0A5B7JYP7_PORTR|nr:hypothetical protein [Portunus trituberculatus]
MITFNICFTVLVLNLNVMGMRGYQVPHFIRVITLFTAKSIFVRIPKIVKAAWDLDVSTEKCLVRTPRPTFLTLSLTWHQFHYIPDIIKGFDTFRYDGSIIENLCSHSAWSCHIYVIITKQQKFDET